jgi:hypothetical protein
MSRPFVAINFAKLGDSSLVTKTEYIITSMTGNTHYPTPTPTIPVVQTAATAFQDTLAAATDGGKIKTAQKNAAREALLDLLRNLALYVQQHCQDDLATLLSSGFEARKEPQPAGVLPAPEGATLLNGTLTGTLNLRSKPVTNARSYEAQTTTDVNKADSWDAVGTFTSTRIELADLTPGTTYWARLRAIGAAGPGAWSDAVSAMAI